MNDENIVNDGYTVWYEDLDTYEPHQVNAVLNIRSERIQFEVEQNLTRFLLKEGIASNDIAYNKLTGKYYSTTEIGYMQLGDALQVFFSPGELFSELLVGGKGLRWTKGYGSLRDTYGDNVIVFDLMNDAAGYICPDETYSVIDTREIFEQSFLRELKEDFRIKKIFKQMKTWLLLVSMGRHTASTLIKAYAELVKSTEAA